MSSSQKPLASQTLFRGLQILEAVASGHRSVQEIANVTGIAFSTAHRLASALVQRNYLQFEPRRGYKLGNKLIELGFSAYQESDLRLLAREELEQLAARTRDTVHLAVLDADQVVYLDKISGSRSIEVSSKIGGHKPICSTGVGKALILDQSLENWRNHFSRERMGSKADDELDSWLQQMSRYAALGYTLDLGEDSPLVRCVAAPIQDGAGTIVAAVSVTSTVDYTDSERLLELASQVQAVAARISVKLGHTALSVTCLRR